MSNQQARKRQALSAKAHIENRPVAGRGVGAVQLPDGVRFFKFQKEGSVKFDILPYRSSKPNLHPYAVDGVWYERTYFVHRNVGEGNASVVCPNKTFGKPCPICEYRSTLDWSDEEDKKRMAALRPQERQLYNVIVYENDGTLSEIMVLDQSRFGFGKMLDDMVKNADKDDDHYQYFSDLELGSTLKVNLTEISGGAFKFVGASSIEFKQRKKPYDESWLDKTVDLDNVLMATSYADISALFYGASSQDDDMNDQRSKASAKAKPAVDVEDDEDKPISQPKPSHDAPQGKPKSKPPVDEEDEDDAPPVKSKAPAKPPVDDDDEDEDEPPVKKAKAPAAKPKVPSDDEDEDEDDVPVKPKASPAAKPKTKISIEDWDDDDD